MNRKKWILDLVLFVWMLVISLAVLTGELVHEWLSVALVPLLIWHLYYNWNWILLACRSFFKKGTSARMRVNLVLDILLYIAFGILILTGILISRDFLPRLGIVIPNDPFASYLHKKGIFILFMLLGAHLGMHVSWILARFRGKKNEEVKS